MRPATLVFLGLLGPGLLAVAEVCGEPGHEECEVAPLLQMPRALATPAGEVSTALASRLKHFIATANHVNLTKKKEWPFAAPDEGSGTVILKRQLTEHEQKIRRRLLARQAVTAAGLIMALMTFSVGMQLVMVEFVMTGTCAMPGNIAGAIGTVILGVISGFRYLFRAPYRLLADIVRRCYSSCCFRRSRAGDAPLDSACPEHLLQEVVSFLPLDALCSLSCSSRKLQELASSENAIHTLLEEVEKLNLQKRWKRHLERFSAAHAAQALPDSESSDRGPAQEHSRESCPQDSALSPPKKALKGNAMIREMRRFLCRQLLRNAEKAHAHQVQEQWDVITDLIRYCMLVIGWFWFSAEVMDMACSEDQTGLWHLFKAISSPAIFLFILESDRARLWWQVVAGLVAFCLLMDLLFDSFRPLK